MHFSFGEVMRDINEILDIFANNYDMDYCQYFDRLKSVLEYCNENVKELQKIQFRGGNESIIDEIVQRIEESLKGIQGDKERELRKITFFLLLNTDATYKYDLKNDQNLCHVVGITPLIPKCLLVSIIWGLKLDKFFYECLTYTPCWFAIQFVERVVASMKYLEPYDVLIKIEQLVTAVFTNICRSDFRAIEMVDKKIILNKFYDHTMELMRLFYTPDIEKFTNWSKREFFKYSGFAIRHLLKMVMFCFNCIEYPLQQKIEEKFLIYEICKESSLPVNDATTSRYSEAVREISNKILMSLCNSLQYNVMLVTLDVFMHWTEVDITEELTLQAEIGDQAYQMLERMAARKEFGHDVQQHLKFIAIRRKTLEENIRDANIGDILRKLESTEMDTKERKMWLDELFTRPIVFGNDECLETISSNVKLLMVENCIKIMDYVRSMQSEMHDVDVDDSVREILVRSLNNFQYDQLIELILYEIRCFGENSTVFQCDDLEQRCTEFFNKSLENFDTKTFLQLCFESPSFVWKKFFNEACISHQHVKNFCRISTSIKKLSKLYFQTLLDTSFTSKYEEKFYPHLLFEIHETEIIDKERFFKSFVYKNVLEMLEAQHYVPLLTILQALSMIVNKTQSIPCFGNITAPVLVMIAQIMDECRWNLVTYSDLNDEIVRLSINCVQATTKTYLPIASERDKQWITDKVKDYRALTQYYFQKYSLSLDQRPKTFDEFLLSDQLTDSSSIDKFLIGIYVRCTMKETEWLAKSEILRPHISDMILLLESVIGELGENAIKNFRNAIINYANIIKKILLPNVQNDNEKIANLGLKILKIIANVPKSLYDEIFMSFHGILLDVFQEARPITEDLIRDVRKYVSSMADCKGKEVFQEKFQAMTSENLI